MVIVYSSNTGYTKQYAELLSDALHIPAYDFKTISKSFHGKNVIYMGWLMAGSIVGYKKAVRKGYDIKAVIGVGMSPESPEQAEFMKKKIGASAETEVFYLQGGYDFEKLDAINKTLMRVKTPDILKRYEGWSEEDKKANATYRMVTEGYSVVGEEHLAPVIEWAKAQG